MRILRADRADVKSCAALDHFYTTSYAWRFGEQEEGGTLSFALSPIRLPRRARIPYPKPLDHLMADLETSACFLVARERRETWGYIDLRLQGWQRAGWIEHLVVASERRRQGIGSALLERATRWAVAHHLRRLMADVPTNNHAAICFLQSHHFVFCGFHERYYAEQDIALFFSKDLP